MMRRTNFVCLLAIAILLPLVRARRAHALLAANGFLRIPERHRQGSGRPQRRKAAARAEIRLLRRSESRLSVGVAPGFPRPGSMRPAVPMPRCCDLTTRENRRPYSNPRSSPRKRLHSTPRTISTWERRRTAKSTRSLPTARKACSSSPRQNTSGRLAVDPQGDLFVATGDTGEVFVVTPDGKGQLFYQSHERHARSLAFDSKGNLLIGTEPDGLVLRVEITRKNPKAAPEAGSAFVVYETNKAEVTSLVTDADGNIYAASIGEKSTLAGNPAHSAGPGASDDHGDRHRGAAAP